jgi:hypothetical protein
VLQLAIKKALLIHPLNTEKHHITVVAVNFCIPFASLCAYKTRESRPPKHRPAATPARVGGRSSFWRAQLCATAHLYERLLPSGASFCTTTSRRPFMGRHYFYSSCIKLDRLLQAAQHVDCWEQHHRSLRHWSCLWV